MHDNYVSVSPDFAAALAELTDPDRLSVLEMMEVIIADADACRHRHKYVSTRKVWATKVPRTDLFLYWSGEWVDVFSSFSSIRFEHLWHDRGI